MNAKNVEIECLRGVAILAVWLAHFRSLTVVGEYLPAFVSGGGAGVQLFFVISGFVVGLSLLRSLSVEDVPVSRVLGAFYLRRVFRIVPMAIVGVLAALLCAGGYQLIGDFTRAHFARDVGLIATLRFNYAIVDGLAGHPLVIYWSLVTEEHFYLFLPILLVLTPSPRLRRALFWGVLLVTALFARPMQALSDEDVVRRASTILYATHLQLDFFAAGVLIALGQAHAPVGVTRGRRPITIAAAAAIAIILGVGRSQASLFGYGMPLVLVAASFLVGAAARSDGLLPFRGRARTILAAIGARSYAIYLLHFPVMLELASSEWLRPADRPRWAHAIVTFLSVTAATLLLVELCHRLVEKPLLRAGARLSARLTRPGRALEKAA